jgi:putative addiction module component (TIGR02574 family)
MRIEQIAAEALRLSEKDRAGLASRLLRSLPLVVVDDDEGVAEALRRDAELDADPSQGITLEELDSQIKQRRRARSSSFIGASGPM